MDKQRYNQIIDEVYEKYHQENKHVMYLTFLLKEEFINKIKKDKEFSENWGLKIDERELSDKERQKWVIENIDWVKNSDDQEHEANKYLYRGHPLIYGNTVPTKQITLTYKNEKIENYE